MSKRPVTIRKISGTGRFVNGRELTDSQARRLDDFSEQVAEAATLSDRRLAKRIEAGGVRGLQALADELSKAAAEDQADTDLTATYAARSRLGDEVERGRDGVHRIITSDGLGLAYARGALEGAEFPAKHLLEIGRLYRACYEAVLAMTTPERHEIRGKGGRKGGVQDSVVAAGQTLAKLRKGQTPAIIDVLDSVCGLDLTVKRAAARLRMDHRTVERRLRAGLGVAAENKRTLRP